jgi:siroheme synthase
MPQEKIHAWVERIIRHVKEVIRLKGGNEYKEGRCKGMEKLRVY